MTPDYGPQNALQVRDQKETEYADSQIIIKPRRYVCPECKRSFRRAEHLSRHERSRIWHPLPPLLIADRKERPWRCSYCESIFSRKDLINRHVQKFHPEFYAPLANTRSRIPQISSASPVEQHSASTVSPDGLHFAEPNVTSASAPSIDSIPFESSNIAPSKQIVDPMPFERTWFAFDWFSDFFKNITEAASSENLLSRNPHSTDGPTNSCKPVTDDDISALNIRIRSLTKSNLLPQDFHLPSKQQMNRYLSAYFGYFSSHTPVVHVQSFDFSTFSRSAPRVAV